MHVVFGRHLRHFSSDLKIFSPSNSANLTTDRSMDEMTFQNPFFWFRVPRFGVVDMWVETIETSLRHPFGV